MKKTLLALFVIIIFVIGFIYLKNNKGTTFITKIDTPNLNLENPKKKEGETFLDINTFYASTTEYEKYLVDSFIASNDNFTQDVKNEGELSKQNYQLRYYDEDAAIFCLSNRKLGCYLSVYDIKNFNKISSDYYINGSSEILIKNHLTLYTLDSIYYFKPGMRDFAILSGSTLTNKNETYVKMGGFLDYYQYSVDEKTNKLKVSVFKNENKNDIENTKLREIEFVLP